jgi:hypothetical protein
MADGIRRWLEKLGLGEYAVAFEENRLDLTHLPDLSEDDLRELGVTAMGDRKTLLRALEELEGTRTEVTVEGRAPTSAVDGGAAATHRDVLRPCRLDGAVGSPRP